MISEGQRNDINYAIPLLDQIEINGTDLFGEGGRMNIKNILKKQIKNNIKVQDTHVDLC